MDVVVPIELDPNNSEDASILDYNARAASTRRRRIALGLCIVVSLFVAVNTVITSSSPSLLLLQFPQ